MFPRVILTHGNKLRCQAFAAALVLLQQHSCNALSASPRTYASSTYAGLGGGRSSSRFRAPAIETSAPRSLRLATRRPALVSKLSFLADRGTRVSTAAPDAFLEDTNQTADSKEGAAFWARGDDGEVSKPLPSPPYRLKMWTAPVYGFVETRRIAQ